VIGRFFIAQEGKRKGTVGKRRSEDRPSCSRLRSEKKILPSPYESFRARARPGSGWMKKREISSDAKIRGEKGRHGTEKARKKLGSKVGKGDLHTSDIFAVVNERLRCIAKKGSLT